MKISKNIALLLFFAGMATLASAQNPDLPSEQVDIIKSFDARLEATDRFQVDPELPPLDTTTRRLDYQVVTKALEVDYLPPKIRPLAMRGDDVPESYNGYLKLGGGFPASLYGNGFYNFSNKENFNLGISALHHSANNNKSVENQRFSYTKVGADYTYQDDAVATGETYWYWLEDVDVNGVATLHGPVSVTVVTPLAVQVVRFQAATPGGPAWPAWFWLVAVLLAAGLIWRRRTQRSAD